MTSSTLPLSKGASRPRRPWPTGSAQCVALVCVLLINALVADNFFAIHIQDGRLFGSLIDILNRCAPVALLSLGMTLVIATGGIDLSVGAVMAISGATMASLATGGHSLPVIFASVIGVGLLCGLWNGLLVAVFKIQPIVATLILMVAGRGIAQLITEGQIITFNNDALAWIGSGALFYLPTPVIITLGMALFIWLLTKRTALGLFIEAVGINIKAAKNAGLNTQPNYQQSALWDTAMLDALPEYEIKTHTPWYDEEKVFRGPRLSDLLAKVGANGKQLTITALNDYSIQVPASDATQYQVILARSINGKPLSVRDKGPLFLIYPFDQYPELRNKLYYSRAICQISRIKVE